MGAVFPGAMQKLSLGEKAAKSPVVTAVGLAGTAGGGSSCPDPLHRTEAPDTDS